MLNLTSLFHTTDLNEPNLLDSLDLTPSVRTYLAQAKTDVRNCLREGIPKMLQAAGFAEKAPTPRFFTQGSWAYKTLNAPAQHPQQADVDDGCYLPLGFVKQTKRPSAATAIFFKAAEACLAVLCREEGWTLITDKPTCIRIEVTKTAHIDVPLYAIPDEEFQTLTMAAMEAYHTLDSAEAVRRAERDSWSKLPSDVVLLAHREEGWWESDPRPVKDWFEAQVLARGEQLRRVIRYLKAFRDWQWPSGGPASILLMAAAVPLFERRHGRDDLALLDVLASLPAALRAGVVNPVDEKESLTERLGKDMVEEAAHELQRFEGVLRASLHASSESQVCIWMQQEFGQRFPNRPHRVKVVSVAATVAAAPAAAGASELVGRSKAG